MHSKDAIEAVMEMLSKIHGSKKDPVEMLKEDMEEKSEGESESEEEDSSESPVNEKKEMVLSDVQKKELEDIKAKMGKPKGVGVSIEMGILKNKK